MREYSVRKLLLCVGLICGFSGLMQVLVFSKRQDLHFRHYSPERSNLQPGPQAGPPVEGVVAAIGMDRVHLNVGNAVDPYRCENPSQYKVGDKLRITFAAGNPPQALKIEKL